MTHPFHFIVLCFCLSMIFPLGFLFSDEKIPDDKTDKSTILTTAKEKETENNITGALQLYKSWLTEYPGDTQFLPVLQHVMELEKSNKGLISFLLTLEPLCRNEEHLIFIYSVIACHEELLGNLTAAGTYYYKAYDRERKEKRYTYLLAAAHMYYQQGVHEKASDAVKEILDHAKDKETLIKASLLHASLAGIAGETKKMRDTYVALIKGNKSEELYPLILLHYTEYLKNEGNEKEIKKIIPVLKKYFPLTPEYYLAMDIDGTDTENTISMYPGPAFFINHKKSDPENEFDPADSRDQDKDPGNRDEITETTDSPEEKQTTENEEKAYIQTGSFLVKDNADDMIKELTKHGFKGIIRKKEIHDKIYFKVLIPLQSDEPGVINDMVLSLKEAGFEGFLVF